MASHRAKLFFQIECYNFFCIGNVNWHETNLYCTINFMPSVTNLNPVAQWTDVTRSWRKVSNRSVDLNSIYELNNAAYVHACCFHHFCHIESVWWHESPPQWRHRPTWSQSTGFLMYKLFFFITPLFLPSAHYWTISTCMEVQPIVW